MIDDNQSIADVMDVLTVAETYLLAVALRDHDRETVEAILDACRARVARSESEFDARIEHDGDRHVFHGRGTS